MKPSNHLNIAPIGMEILALPYKSFLKDPTSSGKDRLQWKAGIIFGQEYNLLLQIFNGLLFEITASGNN